MGLSASSGSWIERLRRLIVVSAVAAFVIAGCTAAPTSTKPQESASSAPSPVASGLFAGLPYRMEIPSTWTSSRSSSYDASIDTGTEMARWLDVLDLKSNQALRAYEPVAQAGGMRVAINPQSPWRSDGGVYMSEGGIQSLPGVEGTVTSDWVATGDGKALGWVWSEQLDWGSGTASRRSCAGYLVTGEYGGIYVVFTWPASQDRIADVHAMLLTFFQTAAPNVTLPPGMTMPPSPTPYLKTDAPIGSPLPSTAPWSSLPAGGGYTIHVELWVPMKAALALSSPCGAADLAATGPKSAGIPGSTFRFLAWNPTSGKAEVIGQKVVQASGEAWKSTGADPAYNGSCVFAFDVTTSAVVDTYLFSVGEVYFPVPIVPRAMLEQNGWIAAIGVNPQ